MMAEALTAREAAKAVDKLADELGRIEGQLPRHTRMNLTTWFVAAQDKLAVLWGELDALAKKEA